MTALPRSLNPQAAIALLAAAVLSLVVSAALGPGPSVGPSATAEGDPAPIGAAESATRLERGYGRLPLAFEPNTGATDAGVDYLARGPGYSLFLSSAEATLSLGGGAEGAGLRMRLIGADPGARASAEERLAGTVNYLRGANEGRWRTGIPTYGEVAYAGVYPGIGVRYHGAAGRLEYDFELAPHADPGRIALRFDGAREAAVAANGDLLLRLAGGGTVRERAPIAYQRIGGERRAVAARFELNGNRVGFALGDYERSRPLTIDPLVLAYSTFLGGGDEDYGLAIAVDAAGAAYLAGTTHSADYPTTPGAFQTTPGGGDADAFVTKLAPDGNSLVYSTYFGGTGEFDTATGIAVDASGSPYVAGQAWSNDFPTTPGSFDTTLGGTEDGFVSKLTPNGQSLAYSTFLGGTSLGGPELVNEIAVDSAGNAYVTGQTASADFPTTAGAFDTALSGFMDAFVTKLVPGGGSLAYSTFLGGTGNTDRGLSIAVNAVGGAYVTGRTSSSNFPATVGAFDGALEGDTDAFVTRLNIGGQNLVYSTYLGGNGGTGPQADEQGDAIAIDAAGSAYVTGNTLSTNFPTTPGAPDATLGGITDAFVTKLVPNGTALTYSTHLGGADDDYGNGIAVAQDGGAYAVGGSQSGDFPTTAGALDTTLGGFRDGFVTRLSPDGLSLAESTYLGGGAVGVDDARAIALDPSGAAYVGGSTQSPDFPTTAGAFDTSLASVSDGFVAKLAPPALTPPPSNAFSFGKLKRKKSKGTARLKVELPGPGALTLAKTKRVKGDSATAAEAGPATLDVAARGKAKRKLRRSGEVKVTAEVTFTPTGGVANTQTKKVKLTWDR